MKNSPMIKDKSSMVGEVMGEGGWVGLVGQMKILLTEGPNLVP